MNSRFQDRAQDDKLKEELTKKLKAFAELYAAEASKDGPYFLGESFSLVRFCFCLFFGFFFGWNYSRACGVMQVDLAIVPFIFRFAIGLSHYRGFDPLAIDEKLKRWHDAVVQRPSWKTTTATPEELIQSMAFYANPPQQ